MKLVVIVLVLFMSWSCFSQFPSTDSYELIYEVPRAKHVGDTVCTSNSVNLNRFVCYVLEKIDRSGRYVYHETVNGGKLVLRIGYDENDKVRSYYYTYREYGGEDKGYFVIHYYPNGNIRDYAQISFYALNQPYELVLYDSLSYREKNPSKIPQTEYLAHEKRGKIFLSEEDLDPKEWRKKIRKRKHRSLITLIEDFPFKTCLLE